MTNQPPLKIKLQEIGNNFYEYLNLEGNNKLIISGRFGIGKTTFINHFFDHYYNWDSNHQFGYVRIHLYPVNYSVANNEDIFEYIKYDILLQLFIKLDELKLVYLPLKDYDFTNKDVIKSFALTNQDFLIRKFLSIVPFSERLKLNKLYETFSDILKKVSEHKKDLNGNISFDNISDFLSEIENKKGSIYEFNIISKIIDEIIKLIQENSNKVILVIDDLDRIDPDFTFRILNILSAHVDKKNEESKFSFDKTLLICDIENIKHIIEKKFGLGYDINGYLDKYYSYEVFEFNNAENIIAIVKDFKKILYLKRGEEKVNLYNLLSPSTGIIFWNLFEGIIELLIRSGELNLRRLFVNDLFVREKVKIKGFRDQERFQFQILIVLDFIYKIYGSNIVFEKAIKNLCSRKEIAVDRNFTDQFLSHAIPFISLVESRDLTKFEDLKIGLTMEIKLERVNMKELFIAAKPVFDEDKKERRENIDLFYYYLDRVCNCYLKIN